MKIPNCSLHRSNNGSILLVAVGTIIVLGIALAAVIGLTMQEYRVLARTGKWNAALPVAEAGIEEAMSHLYENGPGTVKGGVLGYLTIDGWTLDNGAYTSKRTLNSNSYYEVSISTAVPPVITSKGYELAPNSKTSYISRTVQVSTTNTARFTVAFAAQDTITGNGGGFATDSFNSSDPNLSTNGMYTPTKTSTNGDVISVNGPVDLGNHMINGDLYLGPTAKLTGDPDLVTGDIHYDWNKDFPPVVPPLGFTSWLPALPLNLLKSGKIYKYAFLVGGDYTIPDSGSIYVAPGVKVRVRMTTANLSMSSILIEGTGSAAGHLTMFMVGASTTIGGNTTIQSGNAANFAYYGLPSNTSITYGGNSSFIGTIYAPNANLTLSGGGSNNGLIGSSVTKTITLNGHYNFHYDEALNSLGPPKGFTIASWKEL